MGQMSIFAVKVRMPGQLPCDAFQIATIAADAASAIMNMIDRFGPCLVSVQPHKAAQ